MLRSRKARLWAVVTALAILLTVVLWWTPPCELPPHVGQRLQQEAARLAETYEELAPHMTADERRALAIGQEQQISQQRLVLEALHCPAPLVTRLLARLG